MEKKWCGEWSFDGGKIGKNGRRDGALDEREMALKKAGHPQGDSGL